MSKGGRSDPITALQVLWPGPGPDDAAENETSGSKQAQGVAYWKRGNEVQLTSTLRNAGGQNHMGGRVWRLWELQSGERDSVHTGIRREGSGAKKRVLTWSICEVVSVSRESRYA